MPVAAPVLPSTRARRSYRSYRRSAGRRPSTRLDGRIQAAAHVRGLLVWLLLGVCVYLCVPAARGDSGAGATIPFWLIAAPLLNLVWLGRRRLIAAARGWLCSTVARIRREAARNRPRSVATGLAARARAVA
jgi:hypothetical protein